MFSLIENDCCVKFEEPLMFDTFGEKNLTHDLRMHTQQIIDYDQNGVQICIARYNHHRCIAAPILLLHYGANNDTQRLLLTDSAESTLHELERIDKYDNAYFKIHISNWKM